MSHLLAMMGPMDLAVLDRGVEQHVGLAALRAAVDGFCAGFDPEVVTATEAGEVLVELTRLERRLTAVKASAARRVDRSSMWRHAGHRTMAEWLAAQTGEPVGASAGLLDTAKKLELLPATAEALAAGDVSVAAAREIAAAVAADPRAEAGLLAVATVGRGIGS